MVSHLDTPAWFLEIPAPCCLIDIPICVGWVSMSNITLGPLVHTMIHVLSWRSKLSIIITSEVSRMEVFHFFLQFWYDLDMICCYDWFLMVSGLVLQLWFWYGLGYDFDMISVMIPDVGQNCDFDGILDAMSMQVRTFFICACGLLCTRLACSWGNANSSIV